MIHVPCTPLTLFRIVAVSCTVNPGPHLYIGITTESEENIFGALHKNERTLIESITRVNLEMMPPRNETIRGYYKKEIKKLSKRHPSLLFNNCSGVPLQYSQKEQNEALTAVLKDGFCSLATFKAIMRHDNSNDAWDLLESQRLLKEITLAIDEKELVSHAKKC